MELIGSLTKLLDTMGALLVSVVEPTLQEVAAAPDVDKLARVSLAEEEEQAARDGEAAALERERAAREAHRRFLAREARREARYREVARERAA